MVGILLVILMLTRIVLFYHRDTSLTRAVLMENFLGIFFATLKGVVMHLLIRCSSSDTDSALQALLFQVSSINTSLAFSCALFTTSGVKDWWLESMSIGTTFDSMSL